MFGLGPWELVIIFFIVLILFGASRLPELGSGLGKFISNFKKGIKGEDIVDITPKDKENKD